MGFFRTAALPVWGTFVCVILGFAGSQAFANSDGPDTPLEDARTVEAEAENTAFGIAVLSDALGNFVALYPGLTDGGTQIMARRFFADADGGADAAATQINTRPVSGLADEADAAMDARGNFVVVWDGPNAMGDNTLYGQRYTPDLNARGDSFVINESPITNRSRPAVDIGANGQIAVTWASSSGPDAQRLLRRYDATGQPATGEISVAGSDLTALESDVALAPSNTTVVAFGGRDNRAQGVYLQRFDASGGRVGQRIRANAPSSSRNDFPSLAIDGSGNTLLAWSVDPDDTIAARLFNAEYEAVTDPFVVARDTFYTDVAAYASGGFVVALEGRDAIDVVAFPNTGQPAESVRVYSGKDPDASRVAADADGDYAVFWTEDFAVENESRLFIRRFAGPENVDLAASLVADTRQVGPGAAVGYRLTIDNNHDPVAPIDSERADADTLNRAIGAATGVVATLKLPAGVADIAVADINAPQGRTLNCDLSDNSSVVCRLAGALFAGESFTARVRARAPIEAGTLGASLSVTGNQADADEAQDTGNNNDTARIAVGDSADTGGAAGNSDRNEDDGGSGGGCTMAAASKPVDPLFVVLIAVAAGVVMSRRRRQGSQA